MAAASEPARWSGNERVRARAKSLLSRTQRLKEIAEEELKATELLYRRDEPGFLVAEGPREKTAFIKQPKLSENVSVQAQNKMFALDLPRGPFVLDYTGNGRHMLVGGEAGTFASFDWQAGRLACQVDLRESGESRESISDVCFLQNETMFAVAQANYVYMYDGRGIELHRLKKHSQVKSIEYLPYHFLLGSVSADNFIRWQDVTSGSLAAEWRFGDGVGQCLDMAVNPWNAMLNCSHANGVVSMWSPSLNKPLVRMSCHRGPTRALAITQTGSAMATAGLDGTLKVWDLRHEYKCLREYRSMRPVTSLSFSQRNLLAASFGAHVVVWKDALLGRPDTAADSDFPYMRHVVEGASIRQLRFCPFEDVLGIGHSSGVSSVLIPGAGEPNYDIYEANPFAGRHQRQEREVHALLDKLPVETISLDGGQFIGKVGRSAQEGIAADRAVQNAANGVVGKERKRARGRSSAMKRYLRKRANVIDKHKVEAAEKTHAEAIHRHTQSSPAEDVALPALSRFIQRAI